jgi:hypothetical protein
MKRRDWKYLGKNFEMLGILINLAKGCIYTGREITCYCIVSYVLTQIGCDLLSKGAFPFFAKVPAKFTNK